MLIFNYLRYEKLKYYLYYPFPKSGKEFYEKMRVIDELEKSFPTLDLTEIRILLQIHETPGCSIRELAEILQLDPKAVQLKIAVLASGRKRKSRREPPRNGVPVLRSIRRRGRACGLVAEERNLADKRKRSLSTTPRGAVIAEKLMTLTSKREGN